MELSNYQGWRMLVDAIEIIAILILWINRKNQVTADAVANWEHSVNDRIDDNQKELVKLDTQIKNMPMFQNMENVNKEIHKVDNKVSKIQGKLDSIEKKLGMIDQHLMSRQ